MAIVSSRRPGAVAGGGGPLGSSRQGLLGDQVGQLRGAQADESLGGLALDGPDAAPEQLRGLDLGRSLKKRSTTTARCRLGSSPRVFMTAARSSQVAVTKDIAVFGKVGEFGYGQFAMPAATPPGEERRHHDALDVGLSAPHDPGGRSAARTSSAPSAPGPGQSPRRRPAARRCAAG
jgi:hypothetical protein